MPIPKFPTPEEKLLYSKALDRLNVCEKTGETTFTDFLDPVKISAFKPFLQTQGIFIHSGGGHDNAERRMLAFSEAETEPSFPIETLLISYDIRYSKKLTHRDFLGAVIGLQISRDKVGDILVTAEGAYLFIASGLSTFVAENLKKVGSANVTVTIPDKGAPLPEQQGTEKNLLAASMRLDAIISEAFNLSRSEADSLITASKVFVNWNPALNRAEQIKPADMITVRGLGRVAVNEVTGMSKKDRTVVKVILYK